MTIANAGGADGTGSPTQNPKLGCWSCGEWRGGIMGPDCNQHLNVFFNSDAGTECPSFTYEPGTSPAEFDSHDEYRDKSAERGKQ